ncbi:ribosomal RNA processing protein 1 homolog B-like [Impatiens glandulifera]|uniref:ribosomal RNA processing protein 1 homolog B-like n=1 Tax=Impatiens glandulifera TaxID=253017 RepID=UPI001FB0E4EB|nr:ribosomal RNA processing protein 1 homolog B-like [Impatiens glandulifera]
MNGGAIEAAGNGDTTLSTSSSLSLIKRLASCDKVVRDRALKRVLRAWLPSQQPEQVTDDELKKLWKGLFYCVWHADKAVVQLELINRLSALIVSLPIDLSIRYFSTFLITMRREWSGIDHLRLDKFYLLIRRFINASFRLLKGNSWDLELSRRLVCVLEQDALCAQDNLIGSGVNYHIASVFLDELKQFLPLSLETLDVIFKPFLKAMTESHDKLLVTKVGSNMFDVLLKMGIDLLVREKLVGGETSSDSKGDVFLLGTIALKMNFSAKFYESGSSPECFQGNRKTLFGLHEGFLKLEKDMASCGIEISIPVVVADDEDMEPVEEASEGGHIVPITKCSKNKRKAKKAFETDNNKAQDGDENTDNTENKKDKKKKKKKKRKSEISGTEDGDLSSVVANGDNSSVNITSKDDGNLILNDAFISNLQVQFAKVAAEVDLEKNGSSQEARKITVVDGPGSTKRKRTKNKDVQDSQVGDLKEVNNVADTGSISKSAKKVRFAMKNNLVWKPHSPLPPQNLRIPPSLTPRGSALKKGVRPGPIVEMPPEVKKPKMKKHGKKRVKAIAAAIKRLQRL